ncbi:YadA-like family protein, partial [Acinetobacter pollinis]
SDGNLIVGLAKDATFTSVTTGNTTINNDGLTILNGPSVTSSGIDAGSKTITNVADGVNSTDAVNKGQVDSATSGLTSAGLNFAANSGSTIHKNLGETLTIKGTGTKDDSEYDSSNIKTTTDSDGNLIIGLAKDATFTSVTTGNTTLNSNGLTIVNGPSVTSSGIDAGGKAITNVGDGVNATDAATKGQLDTAISNVTNNINALSDNAVKYDKNADGTVNKDKVTLEGGTNGTTLTNVADGTVATGSKDAVNGGQLAGVSNSVANAIGGSTTVNADGTISTSNIGGTGKDNINDAIASVSQAATQAKTTVSQGDNIVVTQTTNTDGSTNYQVATSKDLNVNSIAVGSVDITGSGINAGSQKVTNVADGGVSSTSKDAVNGSQLYTANSNTATYLGGGSTVGSDGQVTAPTYSVAGSTYNNVGSALTAVDNRIGNVENNLNQAFTYTNNRINKLEDRLSAGIAATAALEQAPFIAGKWTYAVGASYYNSQSALGATLRRTADNGRWSVTGGVAGGTEGSPLFRVGVTGVIN